MLLWITQHIILSVLLIGLLHGLFVYLRNAHTKPKIVDLVHHPSKKYNEMLDTVRSNRSMPQAVNSRPGAASAGGPALDVTQAMQSELQDFFDNMEEGQSPDGKSETVGANNTTTTK